MARLNHERRAASDRARRQGIDSIDSSDFLPGGLKPPKRQPSRAELRSELERLTAEFLQKNQKETAPAGKQERSSSQKSKGFEDDRQK